MAETRRGPQSAGVPRDSFVRATGQLWKLLLGGLLLPIAVAVWGWSTIGSIGPDQQLGEVVTDIAILAVGAAVVAGLLASVRCPRCGGRLLKALMKAQEGADAIVPFLRRRECPFCGYHPAKRETP